MYEYRRQFSDRNGCVTGHIIVMHDTDKVTLSIGEFDMHYYRGHYEYTNGEYVPCGYPYPKSPEAKLAFDELVNGKFDISNVQVLNDLGFETSTKSTTYIDMEDNVNIRFCYDDTGITEVVASIGFTAVYLWKVTDSGITKTLWFDSLPDEYEKGIDDILEIQKHKTINTDETILLYAKIAFALNKATNVMNCALVTKVDN